MWRSVCSLGNVDVSDYRKFSMDIGQAVNRTEQTNNIRTLNQNFGQIRVIFRIGKIRYTTQQEQCSIYRYLNVVKIIQSAVVGHVRDAGSQSRRHINKPLINSWISWSSSRKCVEPSLQVPIEDLCCQLQFDVCTNSFNSRKYLSTHDHMMNALTTEDNRATFRLAHVTCILELRREKRMSVGIVSLCRGVAGRVVELANFSVMKPWTPHRNYEQWLWFAWFWYDVIDH